MSEGTPPQLSDEEARQKRQAALRALAQTHLGVPAQGPAAKATGTTAPAPTRPGPAPTRPGPAPTRPGPVAPARTRRRPLPWLLVTSAVLVVAVIAGVVLHQLGRLPGQTAGSKPWSTTVVLVPVLQGLNCIHDVAWSPDGRYLIDAVSLFMRQRPVGRPNPIPSLLQQMDLAAAPNGPIRDRALQRVFLSLATVQPNGFLPTDYVDWSPNGQLLAAVDEFGLPGSSGGAPIVPSVSVYNCATGQLLATLKPEVNAQISLQQLTANVYLGSTTLLRWSPDGSHVLVFSSLLDTISIFGAGQLPGAA